MIKTESYNYRIVERHYQGGTKDYVVEAVIYDFHSVFDTYSEAKQYLDSIRAGTLINTTVVHEETI